MARPRLANVSESIECRYCGCRRSAVEETRIIETAWQQNGKMVDRTVIRRARKCQNCFLRYTTIETYEDEDQPYTPERPETFISLNAQTMTEPPPLFEPVISEDDSPPSVLPPKNSPPRGGRKKDNPYL